MKIEILENKDANKMESLQYEGVNKDILEVGDYKIVRFSVIGNDENAAKKLSKCLEEINDKYMIILSDECSAYFNKRLYPLVNEFERNLRKLLYLKDRLSGSDGTNIKDLESLDFGQVFDLLFIDTKYVNKVKQKINEKSYKFNKKSILEDISTIEEDLVWDKLLNGKIDTLKNQYNDVRIYRNHVMHAHNISFQVYNTAKKLFVKINEELLEELSSITGSNDNVRIDDEVQYSKNLTEALRIYNESMNEILSPILEQQQQLREVLKPIIEQLEPLKELQKNLQINNMK